MCSVVICSYFMNVVPVVYVFFQSWFQSYICGGVTDLSVHVLTYNIHIFFNIHFIC